MYRQCSFAICLLLLSTVAIANDDDSNESTYVQTWKHKTIIRDLETNIYFDSNEKQIVVETSNTPCIIEIDKDRLPYMRTIHNTEMMNIKEKYPIHDNGLYIVSLYNDGICFHKESIYITDEK